MCDKANRLRRIMYATMTEYSIVGQPEQTGDLPDNVYDVTAEMQKERCKDAYQNALKMLRDHMGSCQLCRARLDSLADHQFGGGR